MITFVITFNMITWNGIKEILLEDIPLFSSCVIRGIISSFTEERDEDREMDTVENIGKNNLYNPIDGSVSIIEIENKIESRKHENNKVKQVVENKRYRQLHYLLRKHHFATCGEIKDVLLSFFGVGDDPIAGWLQEKSLLSRYTSKYQIYELSLF